VVYTVLKNGIATAITVSLAANAVAQASDLVNTVAVVLGDRISLRAAKALGIGASGVDVDASVEVV
jgi:divalent metal cation (Fe/Co/Zn/Cd) transporter